MELSCILYSKNFCVLNLIDFNNKKIGSRINTSYLLTIHNSFVERRP